MVEVIFFERPLGQIASFKAPEFAAGFGIYKLKDEAYDKVNPPCARTRRDGVENVLEAKLKKENHSTDGPNPPLPPWRDLRAGAPRKVQAIPSSSKVNHLPIPVARP